MKTLSINPRPFWGAVTRADWFSDPGAVKEWDTTFSIAKKLGFGGVRYQIGLRDTFQNQVGATIPFIFLDSPELWARRIEPVLKYCTVYQMKLLLVIDDIPECVNLWGIDGTAQLLQRVIDKVGALGKYTFGELDPENWQTIVGVYDQLLSRLNLTGKELQAPPMLAMPFGSWSKALSEYFQTPFAAKMNVNAVNVYVDSRFVPSYDAAYLQLLKDVKTVLAARGKPYVIHETGLCPNYAQVDDERRGKMILRSEKMIYQVGGFRDYGIYCANEGDTVPNAEQFSILHPSVLKGYLMGSGYAPTIVLPNAQNLVI